MKLYDCTTAPSPRRVRFFIAEKGLSIDIQQVDLANEEQLGDEFRAINPDCTVPVLELDDGTRISEIFAICQYLEELHPEPPLMGRDASERALVTMWSAKAELQGLTAAAEMFRNRARGLAGRALTGPDSFEQIPQLVERGKRRIELFKARLDSHLAGSNFIVGDHLTIADISAYVFVELAAWSKIGIGEDQVNLQRWFDEVNKRPAARA
jgi:glutathione S-transferase